MKKIKVAGLRQVLNLSQIEVLSLPRRLEIMDEALALLAENGINLEFIVAHPHARETMDLVLGVQRNRIAATLGLLQGLKGEFGIEEIRARDEVGMVSLFPHGNRAAVIGHFFSAFQDAGVKPLAITFSLSAISGLTEERFLPDILRALSEYFELPG